jgi:hypothetical protein
MGRNRKSVVRNQVITNPRGLQSQEGNHRPGCTCELDKFRMRMSFWELLGRVRKLEEKK